MGNMWCTSTFQGWVPSFGNHLYRFIFTSTHPGSKPEKRKAGGHHAQSSCYVLDFVLINLGCSCKKPGQKWPLIILWNPNTLVKPNHAKRHKLSQLSLWFCANWNKASGGLDSSISCFQFQSPISKSNFKKLSKIIN